MSRKIEIGHFPRGLGQSFEPGKELEGLKPGSGSLSPIARKVRTTVELATAVSLLASCSTPGVEAASPTINPATPDGLTPTPSPENPTPSVPTIEVDGLKLPDPKISNPELFDITKQDSPIVEFANAFGITPDQVGELTPEVKTAVDGTKFAVLTTSDLPQTANFDESGTPLMIAEQGENGEWSWGEIGLKDLEFRLGLEVGDSLVYKRSQENGFAIIDSDNYHNLLANNYSVITLAQGTYWKWFEPTKDGPVDRYSRSDILAQIKILKDIQQQNPSLKVRIAPFGSFAETNPDWLTGLSEDEAKIQIKEHMQQLFDLLTQNGITPDQYVVVNEPFFQGSNWVREDALYNSFGGYNYITYAFTTAREIVGDKPLLIYNDTANNSESQYPYSFYTNLTKQNINRLKEAGVENFAVGMQMHLYGDAPINEDDLIRTMQEYGVPVYITELDVDVSMLSEQNRNQALSDIYTSVFRAAIKSGVCQGISTWNGVDDLSTAVDYEGKADASPTLFSGSINPQPKEVYYKILKELLSNFGD